MIPVCEFPPGLNEVVVWSEIEKNDAYQVIDVLKYSGNLDDGGRAATTPIGGQKALFSCLSKNILGTH